MNKITGIEWKEAIISGANNLENKKNSINALNVFPVPDGDTGSNMAMTIMAAKSELEKTEKVNDISVISKLISQNMLLGARGNSGVILSQIFKGFSKSFQDKKEVTIIDMVEAFSIAAKTAYSAVLKPVEGTILTVIRQVSEDLKEKISINYDFNELFKEVVLLARNSCDNTPNLLQVLKDVGVTDSGAEGLFAIFEGMSLYFQDKPVSVNDNNEDVEKFISDTEVYNGEFGYCTEFILDIDNPKKFNKEEITQKLEKNGSSMVIVQDDNLFKVHIHTKKPGSILNLVNSFGQFVKIKIENMTIQANNSKDNANNFNNKIKDDLNRISNIKKCGLISCNYGQGIINLAKEYGANFVVEGGQTNNPSTKDLVNAIQSVNAKTIFILPNNSNIILSAQQAATIVNDKKIVIIPTKSQAQCLSVIMSFSQENSETENQLLMKSTLKNIKYAEIAPSIKDVKINGVKIKKGEYMAVVQNKIVGTSKTYNESAKIALEKMLSIDSQIATIIYGQDASEADAKELAIYLETNYGIETQIYSGEQKIYPYFISVE